MILENELTNCEFQIFYIKVSTTSILGTLDLIILLLPMCQGRLNEFSGIVYRSILSSSLKSISTTGQVFQLDKNVTHQVCYLYT